MKKFILGLILIVCLSHDFATAAVLANTNITTKEHTEQSVDSDTSVGTKLVKANDGGILKKPRVDLGPNTGDGIVVLVGYFSNQEIGMVEDSPHISGYSLELYRMNNQMYGRFIRGTGSEDPLTTLIYDTQYDRKRGRLFFKAKLSEGMESNKKIPDGRPSKDLFEFSGSITSNAVAGKIEHKSGYEPDNSGDAAFIKLIRNRKVEKFYADISPKTRQELEKYLSEMSSATSW